MNISVIKGETAIFKCSVSKEANVVWKFKDLVLDFASDQFSYSNVMYFTNGTLQIAEAKNTDIGIGKSLVNSVWDASADNDNKAAYLNVVELPYAPGNVNAYCTHAEFRVSAINSTGE